MYTNSRLFHDGSMLVMFWFHVSFKQMFAWVRFYTFMVAIIVGSYTDTLQFSLILIDSYEGFGQG